MQNSSSLFQFLIPNSEFPILHFAKLELARHAEQRRALTVPLGCSAKHLHYVGSFNQGALRVHPTKARRGKCSVKAPKVKPLYKRRFRESRSDFSLGLASQSLARLCRAAQVKRFGAQNDEFEKNGDLGENHHHLR